MNYYEELGLTKSATTEEIRQAYKNVARLLHPDQHQDERLRLLAECQMKRLNEIVAVLTDPERRREYEAGLEGTAERARNNEAVPTVIMARRREARESSPLLRFASRNWAWVLIGAIGLGSMLWYFGRDEGREAMVRLGRAPAAESSPVEGLSSKQEPGAGAHATSESRRQKERPQAREARAEVEAGAAAAVPAVKDRTREPPAAGPPSSAVSPPERQALSAERAVVPQTAPAPSRGGFAGSWFYGQGRRETPPENLYPAEYIELVVSEEAGALGGRYRARYRVADQAISPEVTFQFEGRASENSAHGRWTGGGGAKGEVQLKLLSVDSMGVTWWATDLGKGMGLASGTAVLIRLREP